MIATFKNNTFKVGCEASHWFKVEYEIEQGHLQIRRKKNF